MITEISSSIDWSFALRASNDSRFLNLFFNFSFEFLGDMFLENKRGNQLKNSKTNDAKANPKEYH